MAISEQVVSTLIEAVAGLNARFNDLSKLMALPGPQGEPGPQGPQGEQGPQGDAASDEQIKAAASEWLAANITQPKDGAPGRDPTEEEIALAVEIWFAANAARLRGPRGPAGPAGKDGADGAPGRDGRDGRDGSNGQDGIGIALIEQRDRNSFFITLTNGDEFEIELPEARVTGSFGGGGGIRSITSTDGTVIVTTEGSTVNLSVPGGGGGGSGLTFTGDPITTSGTITAGGTLAVANGGTGATTLTGLVVGNGTSALTAVTAPAGAVVGTTDTQTLTSKRITPRVNAQTTTSSLWAWNSDSYDQQSFSALANALTINADAGTPTDGQKAMFRFKDNGTARALTWTTGTAKSFRAIGVTLPTTTVANKTTYVGCVYNAADSRWDAVAVTTEV